jgi:uncharacterized membrane protein
MTVALVQPKIPVFLHVGGAMVLVGALIVVAWTLVKAWRGDADAFVFLGARVLTFVAIPSFLVMRVAAQVVASNEGYDKSEPSWINIGFGVSDGGFLFLLISSILVGLAARRLRRGTTPSPGLVRVAAVLTLIPLAAYVVAIWAMTTKPA